MENAAGCVVGASQPIDDPTATFPDATTRSFPVVGTVTTCLPSTKYVDGDFDVDLTTLGDASATTGAYTVTFSSGAMVGGIITGGNSSTNYSAGVLWSGSGVARAPVFASSPASGIPIGFDYAQNLNATSPSGGAVTYASLAGSGDGPVTDVITLGAGGLITIPAATTATMSQGDAYVYRIQAADTAGNFVQRMALLKATTNAPPTIAGLDEAYFVLPGRSAAFPFSAADSPGQTVSLHAFGAPPWVTLEMTPGNPAAGTLRVAPPADLAAGTRAAVNIDAVDSDTFASLVASRTVTFVAGAAPSAPTPAPPAPAPAPAPEATAIVPLAAPRLGPTRASRAAGETRVVNRLRLTRPGRYTFIFRDTRSGRRVVQLDGSRLGPRTLRRNHSAPVLVTSASRKIALISLFGKRTRLADVELRVVLKRPDGTLVDEAIG